MLGRASRICNVLRHGFWVPKLRVVEAWICKGIGEFERGVERFCEVGSSGFVSSGGPSYSGFAAGFDFGSSLSAEADLFCEFAALLGIVWRDHRIVSG